MQTDHGHASPRDSPLGAGDYAHDAPRLDPVRRGVLRARVPGLRHMRYPVRPQSAEHSRMAFPGMAAKWSRPPRLGLTFERRSRLGLEAPEVRETSRGLDLDLKSWRNVQDPFHLYAWLRDHDPLHWSESLSAWVVTRYEDVVAIFDPGAQALAPVQRVMVAEPGVEGERVL